MYKTILFIPVAALLGVAVYALAALHQQDVELANAVIAGEVILSCQMQDGWRQIDAAKVVSTSDGRWVFTNGSATNCEVTK